MKRGYGGGVFAGTSEQTHVNRYRLMGIAGFPVITGLLLVSVLAPVEGSDVFHSGLALATYAASMLGVAALAKPMVRHTWIRFGYGVLLTSTVGSVVVYFSGPQASSLVAMGYVAVATLSSLVLPRLWVAATVLLIAVEYGIVIALHPGWSNPLNRWLAVLLLVGFMAVIAHRLAELVGRLQTELSSANRNLEHRVDAQVSDLERLGRLRRFLPSAVASAVVDSETELELEPHRRQIACAFIDLRGFTRFTSEAEPEEVIEALRAYHAVAGGAMAEYGATVGPLMGDGMMAYFNDPLPCDDPPQRATEMALALKPRLDAFAEVWTRRGYGLSYGIGVAFGYATLGVVGFEGRQEYTPVGTVANLASRLCDAAVGGQILMDQRTYARISGQFSSAPLDSIEVKGFDRPVNVVAITGAQSAAATIGGALEDTP